MNNDFVNHEFLSSIRRRREAADGHDLAVGVGDVAAAGRRDDAPGVHHGPVAFVIEVVAAGHNNNLDSIKIKRTAMKGAQ